jgi:hypothetical protein
MSSKMAFLRRKSSPEAGRSIGRSGSPPTSPNGNVSLIEPLYYILQLLYPTLHAYVNFTTWTAKYAYNLGINYLSTLSESFWNINHSFCNSVERLLVFIFPSCVYVNCIGILNCCHWRCMLTTDEQHYVLFVMSLNRKIN